MRIFSYSSVTLINITIKSMCPNLYYTRRIFCELVECELFYFNKFPRKTTMEKSEKNSTAQYISRPCLQGDWNHSLLGNSRNECQTWSLESFSQS